MAGLLGEGHDLKGPVLPRAPLRGTGDWPSVCAHGLSGFVQLRFLQPHSGLLAPRVNDRVLHVGFHTRAPELPEVRNLGVECRVSVADEDELGTRRGTVTGLCPPAGL